LQVDVIEGIQEKERPPSPPYISFLTFNNCITWLDTEGIPLRFDRSFWQKKYSGSTGPQVMSGLRFLGLLKGDAPQPRLEALVRAEGYERKTLLARIFREAYKLIDFDSLPRATPSMLRERFHAYNLEGDTLRKAESFFINGCKSVDIPLSNALRKKARNKLSGSAVGASKERKRGGEKVGESIDMGQRQPQPLFPGKYRGQISRIALVSGGEVTLALNVDLFQLSKEDRDFVLSLVDIMKAYDMGLPGQSSG